MSPQLIKGLSYKQGDFDGLCGVYSILNAINILLPDTSREVQERYFGKLVLHIIQFMSPRTIVRGIGPRQMWSLIQRTPDMVRRSQRCSLMIEWAKADNADDTWQVVRDHVSRDSVAIIGLSGELEHWTAVADINRRYAKFADSGSISGLSIDRLRRKCSGTRISIDSDAIFVLTRT